MGKKLLKLFVVSLVICLGLAFLAGCAQNNSIEGTWILKEEYDSKGTKITSEKLKEIGVAEKYEIKGTEVKYTCETTVLKKPVSITFVLEDLGNNKYNFNMSSGFTFATVEVKGDTMTYTVGEGKSLSKMVFKRQK